ncbi:DNA structure-specific ATPase involved in suppression of recombination, MutS family [Halalkaliarchaeum sp. AArc-CO]|uniref:helix-hairpin-helix domain-containing protein n=1 Tax=Halalkaliarchaeum sp. AArc-CO TaxID=2866381 RepID=UPI00217DEC60|nr:helix-hairpin-helix domain-containing protein [Halalkaliarchaeum sp. AArc-CO]UWG49554.1 DNA structure-specific ATPase involved in suppression of recombination, MutS family [Halalkaliarchaeum sp. AArc-CO]
MELEDVPGVGEKTASALSQLEDPERALREGDVAAIARAPGISEGRAAVIARGAIRRRHGDHGSFLVTDRAREIYRDALGLLKRRAETEYAKKRLETFYPSASTSRIAEAREFTRQAIEREPDQTISAALEGVEPLETPSPTRVRERCLATADAERYAAAERRFPELSVEVIEDRQDVAELARSYSTVIVLDEAFAGMDVAGDVQVRTDVQLASESDGQSGDLETTAEIVPERLLSFFAHNRETLRAAVRVHEAADLEPTTDPERLRGALSRVDEDGTVVGDGELDRLSRAVDDLDAAVGTAESVANDHLRAAIGERDVTIEGRDFLSLVEQGARVDSLLSRELHEEYEEAIRKAREQLVDALALSDGETELAERVFGGEPTFPVERNEEAVSRLRTELSAARDRRAARLKTELAADLAVLREPVETLVADALELDVELAISRFYREYDCTIPTVLHDELDGWDDDPADAPGIEVVGGRSPLLDVDFEAVEPVDYRVSGVTLLSGVNSGGKTSTLDLLGLVAVLSAMGLPVPAEEARLRRFSGLHYYAKSQGTLDAGAFESTVREFGDLVDGADDRLVLVDELESITEPGASAKIVAGILEELDRQDATAVFVSHLAREIREAADFSVAVDGIEAVGLEDGELVVERSPVRNHLARSTPELIVEKLAGESDATFYERLLEKF